MPRTSATTFVTPPGRADDGGDGACDEHAQMRINIPASTLSDFIPISGSPITQPQRCPRREDQRGKTSARPQSPDHRTRYVGEQVGARRATTDIPAPTRRVRQTVAGTAAARARNPRSGSRVLQVLPGLEGAVINWEPAAPPESKSCRPSGVCPIFRDLGHRASENLPYFWYRWRTFQTANFLPRVVPGL